MIYDVYVMPNINKYVRTIGWSITTHGDFLSKKIKIMKVRKKAYIRNQYYNIYDSLCSQFNKTSVQIIIIAIFFREL